MIINITQRCTLRCPHCMQNAGPERNEMMSKEVFEQAIQFAHDIGSKVVSISGGEPTCHPMFFDFLEVALSSGFMVVSVLSNGTFIKDHAFTERFAKITATNRNFYLQISSFKGLYANYDEVHKPNLKALRLFGDKVVVCDNPNDIQMKPLGRACSGQWYEEAKRVNGFPSCINSSLILAQSKAVQGIGVGALMERHQRFCLPIVSWDGSIRLGEAEQCKVIANVSGPLHDINQKLIDFRPCGGCDSYKWHLQNPSTEQEKKVCKILWNKNINTCDENDDRHCSECVHYEPCTNCQMYCKALQRRITARKTPRYCKYYQSFIKDEKKEGKK